jgi:GNAT superfamily N-acetyltransferase
MFTIEEYRQMGVGTATLTMLIEECRQRGLRPIAGCARDNHLSKKTLERAGMYSPTRLLKIGY